MTALFGLTFSEDSRDYLKFIGITIVPRVILAILLSLLFADLDNYASFFEVGVFVVFFLVLIYHFLPPMVDTVFVVKRTGDPEVDAAAGLKLMRASKDAYSGLYTLERSFVIKSYVGRAAKYFSQLKLQHDFAEYEVTRKVKSIKGFNEEYHQLLDRVAWKLMEGHYRGDVVHYNLKNLEAIDL